MRVLICGDRHWGENEEEEVIIFETVFHLKEKFGDDLIIVEGEAPGADSIARDSAEMLWVEVSKFTADWARYGKSAGPIRNKQMLQEGKPQLVIAFHKDIENSRGTKHMVNISRDAGIPVIVIEDWGPSWDPFIFFLEAFKVDAIIEDGTVG